MSAILMAGAARVDITPPLGSVIPGLHTPRYAEAIDDPLYAKALVLECGGTRVAMVTCDLIALPEKTVRKVRECVLSETGIPAKCLMVNATHTHTGAGVGDLLAVPEDREYTAWVPGKISEAVANAVEAMRPAKVGFGEAEEHGISFYRRWEMKDGTVRMNPGVLNPDRVRPMGEIDPSVPVMYVEGQDGRALAVVTAFSLHYVGTDNNNAISADYFGHFDRQIGERVGGDCVGILWNACSGQINNIDFSGKTERGKGHAQAARAASVLVDHVTRAVGEMALLESVELGGALSEFEFVVKRPTEEDMAIARGILADPASGDSYEKGPFSWVVGQPIPPAHRAIYATECLRLADLPERMTAEMQVLRIGKAKIVAFPGEVFVEIGNTVRERLVAADPLFLVSLANGYIGYICTDRALQAEGGYETWAANSSLPGVGTEGTMIEAAVDASSEFRVSGSGH